MEMILPPSMSSSTTPWNARNAARVTTKDGMPIFATKVPRNRPTMLPVNIAAAIATYHGRP